MDMATNQKSIRIVISGYYGFNNSGDEAVLRSILLALKEQADHLGLIIEPVVLSGNPEWTSKMYEVEAVPRMHMPSIYKALKEADGLISGGGSLLQDATGIKTVPYYTGIIKIAQWLKKPTFIYAQGVGPVHRSWLFPFIKSAMNGSQYISVRDEQSAQFLRKIGVSKSIEVVPDPVMGMPLPSAITVPDHKSDKPVVGVSVRFWRQDRADLLRVADALVKLSQKRDVCIRFLSFHTPEDIEASKYVMSHMKIGFGTGSVVEMAHVGDDPQQMLYAVSQCQVLFGMRLHALIYAANQQVPLLGLSYDPKIDQFLKQISTLPIGTTAALDDEACSDAILALIDQKEAWLEHKKENIVKLKEQSQKPAQQIVKSLRK